MNKLHNIFEKLSHALDTNKAREQETASQLVAILLKNESEYLSWLTTFATDYTKGDKVAKMEKAQSVRNVQNCFNKAPTQKQYFKIEPEVALTEKARVKRANKKLMADGQLKSDGTPITESDIKSKQYFLFTSKIDVPVRDAQTQMQKVQKEFSLSKKEMTAILSAIKYA